MKLTKKISFIGFGRMGGALASGAVAAGAISRTSVIAYDPEPAARAAAKKQGFRTVTSEADAVLAADIVFLCVKPQQMAATLDTIAALPAAEIRRRCFVSIAAGVPISRLQAKLGARTPVLRVMPNTPALLGAGASGVSRGRAASAVHEKWVSAVLGSVGVCVPVPERAMDAVTALSGSGPAYVFYLAEAMTEAGRALGLPAPLARALARQTIYGGGLMLHRRPEEAEELRRQVTSPGGTTAAAIAEFDRRKLKALVAGAMKAAAKRSAEQSRI